MSVSNGELQLMIAVRDRLRAVFSNNETSWAMTSRAALAGENLDPPQRDLDAECGYPSDNPGIKYYKKQYDRGGIPARVVNIWPDECWASYPALYQTEKPKQTRWEKEFKALSQRTLMWHYLHRADRLSRIGNFGILLLGLDDGGDLSRPPPGVNAKTGKLEPGAKPHNLLYLRAFDQSVVNYDDLDDDDSTPRFNSPTLYTINHNKVANEAEGVDQENFSQTVHWTRVVHLADNRECSEIAGVPAMRPVLNYLHDIRKVSGSSAEMFWKGGFPGYQFEGVTGADGILEVNYDAIKEEIYQYINGLQRYLTGMNGKWAALAQQIADPTANLTQLLTLLCATIGVPLRIFLGSESGHLASTQDASTWKERLHGRQVNYLEPMVVRPLIERLMDLGCVRRIPEYIISWQDLKSLGELDKMEFGLKLTQALSQYVTGDVQQALPLKFLYTAGFGFTDKLSDEILLELKNNPPPPPIAAQKAPGPQGGGRTGNPAKTKPGRPAGKLPKNKQKKASAR